MAMKRMTYLCRIGRTSLGLPRQAKADMSIKTAQLPALCLLNQYGIKKLSTVSDNKSKKCLVKSGKDINFPRAIFSFLFEIFSCLPRQFSPSAKKKFVTKFVTRITKFVTCVRKFVTAVTKFVINFFCQIVKIIKEEGKICSVSVIFLRYGVSVFS